MDKPEVFCQLRGLEELDRDAGALNAASALARKIAAHKEWLQSIRRERPSTENHWKVGVYIRFFNQTRHEDYLNYHKKQFIDTIALCPNWELVDFYIDEGAAAPHMESATQWCRLLEDCMDGRVDLILTQKISNVSRKPHEITICARLLARQTPPVGIYFISEDLYTLASYYLEDMRDTAFFPAVDWIPLSGGEEKETLHD